MTDPVGPDAHLGLDRVADLEEGLLSPAEEQAAREHLAGCDVCQADLAALAAVRAALLADAEIALPDDVADRLYAALAEQPPLAPAVAAATTLPVRTGPSRWERTRKPVLATLAAAACIALLAVGIIHLPRSSSSSAGSASAGAAAVTSAAAPVAGPEILHSGHDYSAQSLGADGAALLGPTTSRASRAPAAATSAAAAAPTSAAAAAVTSAGAASAAAPTTSSVPAAPAPTTDALSELRDPAAAQRCVSLLLGSTTPPHVIDYATFAGKPAVIAVADDPKDATKLAVIAVGPPGCALYSLNFLSKP